MNEYMLSENMLKAIVAVLNDLPASRTRLLLNAIEAECLKQDADRAETAKEALRAEGRNEGKEKC